MPRPPLLPIIDWKNLFASGRVFSEWLAAGESPDKVSQIRLGLDRLELDADTRIVLKRLNHTVHVLAIAEDWCGDVVRHVPVLEKMAAETPHLQVRYIKRADSLETFARFLTNGGEAIPKFVFLNEYFVECGNWGPMPAACKELIARGKACGDVGAARAIVSDRYKADPMKREVVVELLHLIDITSSVSPQVTVPHSS